MNFQKYMKCMISFEAHFEVTAKYDRKWTWVTVEQNDKVNITLNADKTINLRSWWNTGELLNDT